MNADPDDAFFAGETDELAPFEVPPFTFEFERDPGMPWSSGGEAGDRLRAFAHRTPAFDWVGDPRRGFWNDALPALNAGGADEPIEGDTTELWQLMFAVVRADRFNDGLVPANAVALTRIANEIRRRLLHERGVLPT